MPRNEPIAPGSPSAFTFYAGSDGNREAVSGDIIFAGTDSDGATNGAIEITWENLQGCDVVAGSTGVTFTQNF